jgi:hypothetical protein
MRILNKKNFNDLSVKFLIIAIFQFIIFSTLAMIFYRGGTLRDPNLSNYSFWANYFSDLGRTKSLSGKSNLLSCVIYTISGITLAISVAPFTFGISQFFSETKLEKILSRILIILGFVTSFFWIATMITPWDLYGNLHIVFGMIYTTTGFILLLLLAIMIFSNNSYPNKYAFVLLYYFGIYLFNFLLILILSYDLDTLVIQATFQKIVVYFFLFTFLYIAYGALKFKKILSINQ